MNLYFPFKNKCYVTQSFAKNANSYYEEDHLAGHTGVDLISFHGDTIYAATDGIVYSVLNKDNPDLMRYRAVYQLVDDVEGGIAYELTYGHLGDIFVEPIIEVKRGTPLGTQSNTGDVASGGIKITREMKMNGSTAGSHLHFQVRLLKKVKDRDLTKQYIMDGQGLYQKDGCFFEVVNYQNGFKGAVDPSQFWIGKYAVEVEVAPKTLQTTLRYGSRGDQVKLLQNLLKIKQDGIFGIQTEKAVKAFQTINDLSVDGIVGPLTRAKLNK